MQTKPRAGQDKREKASAQTHAWGGALHLDNARPKACTSDLGLDNAVSCPAVIRK